MNVLKKVKNLFTSDGFYFLAFYFLRFTRLERLVPDEPFLKLKFRCYMRQKLHLDPPVTFNEKLQWLKLHDHNPLYTTLVDKVEVKKYVANIIGEEYIIPTLGVWDSVDDIDFDALPNQFVLKCNHDSGGIVICKDKSKLDITAAKKKLRKALRSDDAFYGGREWPYKNVKKRILAEKYMSEFDRQGVQLNELKDYKFFCFDGEVKALFVASDRQNKNEDTKFDFFDADFNHLDLRHGHPNATHVIEKPKMFEEMKDVAKTLSKGFRHLRVDLYEVADKIYFGELTLFHHTGMVQFEPPAWDAIFGEWLRLPFQIES